MPLKKMLALLSLLVMFGSAQAQMTDSAPSKDWFWNTGIFGAFVPGTSINFYPGMYIGWSSNIRKYNVGADFRLTWPRDNVPYTENPGESEYGFIFWCLTARYFFSEGDVAPLIGAGISVGTIYSDNGRDDGNNEGFGAHVTFGVEMFRFGKSRLRLEARADLPFFKHTTDFWVTDVPYEISSTSYRRSNAPLYLMPISIGISYHR